MWSLYLTAKTTASRPSSLVKIQDDWTALQFDNAVTMVGRVVENAGQELHNVGTEDKPKMEPKYTMAQLLSSKFHLPTDEQVPIDPAMLKGVEGVVFDEVS